MKKMGKKIGLLVFLCLVITMLVFWLLPMGSLFACDWEWDHHIDHNYDSCPGEKITIEKKGLLDDDTAIFTLSCPDGSEKTLTFVGNGTQSFGELPEGTYNLKEDWDSGNVWNYTSDLDTGDIVLKHGEDECEGSSLGATCDDESGDIKLTVTNCPIVGSIQIEKSGFVEGSGDSAKFSLTGPGGPVGDIILDASNPVDGWDKLPAGEGKKYSLTEAPATGNMYYYDSNLSTAEFEIIEGSNVIPVVNDPTMGSITINKEGLLGTDTATFTLKGPISESLETKLSVAKPSITIEDLPFGEYTLEETWDGGNANQYTTDLTPNPYTFSLDKEGENFKITVVNTPVPGPGSGLLRLTKFATGTTIPVEGADYGVFLGSTLVEKITTASDGTASVSLPLLDTVYTVKELLAPAGYDLDPNSYNVSFTANNLNVTLNVFDSPSGGGPTITVAGLQAIQVLAFTGLDPIIPISGGSVIAGGLGLFIASFLRKIRRNKK